MESEDHLEDSNPEVRIEVDPPESQSQQNQTTELEEEENMLQNALFGSDWVTMECLAWTSLSVAILELILLFVVFILILNKY